MDVIEFFNKTSSLSDKAQVFCFIGKSYTPFFFNQALSSIEKAWQTKIKKIAIEDTIAAVQAQLHTTFLGETFTYWLGDAAAISSLKKKRSDFINYISTYTGPHTLIVFVSEEDAKELSDEVLKITIASKYTSDQIKKCAFLYEGQKPEQVASFYHKLFRIKKDYSLDELCLLREYASLLGKNVEQFFETWVEKLVISDISLFYLSQLFFEKNAKLFFQKWHDIRLYYPDQFWIAFFSEQLFKAYFYVENHGNMPSQMKSMTFGLPFSFLKQDWHLYTTYELQAAHQRIYEIDRALKSGGSSYRLDAFFIQFFTGLFA